MPLRAAHAFMQFLPISAIIIINQTSWFLFSWWVPPFSGKKEKTWFFSFFRASPEGEPFFDVFIHHEFHYNEENKQVEKNLKYNKTDWTVFHTVVSRAWITAKSPISGESWGGWCRAWTVCFFKIFYCFFIIVIVSWYLPGVHFLNTCHQTFSL